ncbi:uncharacterized protein A1O5_09803 [Cladophialophora psammophila CBS 110553]|uniref:NADPH-dependent FMN reductase-like domain-containing protein n=1 Tax=Cladophialophora psammophila CBS 110553 TaxID=1182543 RepID=W9WR51_9EURO|nr:uncharacterized protein A1O5_09803 [Cladophialophora psammophila CBS 110553]EXJ67156.1 hypothetical protein A1O5_09803 [Cladophialophora psammophila CBS 110553]
MNLGSRSSSLTPWTTPRSIHLRDTPIQLGLPRQPQERDRLPLQRMGGKPAMVVSYGGHGGGQCAGQLKQVLGAVRMKVVQKSVGLTFPGPGREFLAKAARGDDLGLVMGEGLWAKEAEEVKEVFDELLKILHEE